MVTIISFPVSYSIDSLKIQQPNLPQIFIPLGLLPQLIENEMFLG